MKQVEFNVFDAEGMHTYYVTYYSEYLTLMQKFFGAEGVTDICDAIGMVHGTVMDAVQFCDTYGWEHEDPEVKLKPPRMTCPACHGKDMEYLATSMQAKTKNYRNGDKLYAVGVYKCSKCGCVSKLPDTKRQAAMNQHIRCAGDRSVRTGCSPRDNLKSADVVNRGIVHPLLESAVGTDYHPLRSSAEKALRA